MYTFPPILFSNQSLTQTHPKGNCLSIDQETIEILQLIIDVQIHELENLYTVVKHMIDIH